ncbi:polyprenyl synthetase family protein [Roseobacter sinensis]|uniref:Polyprenyl synthetase family protein n=1 Tax=Roseobacter sinensis TaxID=2931391 RepID=A0ABT3B8C0_9RHOB|nr:farnesyl diphosphate synthase [Roseobacter sp. WL0113]MCV3269821.1 polyprenyl synthetase family protein [Roseobacter sp. WL0113]
MFSDRLGATARAIQAHFDLILGKLDDLPVVHAMRHATNGGKRLRGFLVMEGARLHGVAPERAIWPATAIEALHAYSLVHDDLPCMDNDDMRRGQPTVHRKWDEATAVLAGDALQTLAFELVTCPEASPEPWVRADLALRLAQASGAQGMVLGQALDIAAETAERPLSLDDIARLQQGKTGALIEWAATAGAVLGQSDPAPLQRYARALGLAFQIADDLLDVTGDSAMVGKAVGKDAHAGKATFVSLLGLEAAQHRAAGLVEEACDSLAGYGAEAETLKEAARFVVTRAH